MRVGNAADHGWFNLKQEVAESLRGSGYGPESSCNQNPAAAEISRARPPAGGNRDAPTDGTVEAMDRTRPSEV
jgi:hypothetical protein